MLQVLHPVFDPGFSQSSYGFRPGRSARQAVLKAQEHAQAGYTCVVDLFSHNGFSPKITVNL